MADGKVEIQLDLDTKKAETQASKSGKNVGNAFTNGVNSGSKSMSADLSGGIDGASKKASGAAGIGGKLGGTAFAGAFKTAALAGIAAVGTAAIAIGQQSIQAYAEYEQLTGGAAKIFDEVDQTQILNDANEAWKTMNMSANEYMASMNQVGAGFAATMGDQKGYDTAKAGMQAIADFASGTGRSVNELNDKYALITRSTSSYASIADQFSGVLPASTEAFLEQAQAAGFLSKEYKSLSEVPIDEYQYAVTMMLDQGVKDMGLYQNTMNETAGTISGSLAGLTAQWQNWLVALADENADIEAMTNQLVDGIIAAAGNIIPKLGDIAVSLITQLPNFIVSFVAAIISHIPDIILGAFQLFSGLVVGLVQAIPNLLAKLGNMVLQIIQKFRELPDKLVQAGKDMIKGLWEGISQMGDWVIDKIKEFAGDIVDGFLEFMGIHSPSKLMADLVGKNMALGIAVGFEDNDPFPDIQRTLSRGVAGMSIAASLASGTTTTNNQTLNFNQPVSSPDQIARAMRMQQRYGLAGAR